jgi:hypothetical protein
MDPNVALPFASSVLSFAFFVFLIDQWRERRRPYQLIWAIGMLWYAISAGTEFIGGALGWNEALYRAWYLIGAIWVAAWLGLGTVYLLARTRFGYSFSLALGLAGVFTFLSWRKYDYPNSGVAPFLYLGVALVLALLVAAMTFRRDDRWVHVAGGVVVAGSVASVIMVATATLPPPGWIVDETTHIPTGELFPGYLRLLTPFFNITGAFALVLGAFYSAYVFMPKRRIIRYSLDRHQPVWRFIGNLAIAPVAIVVNFIASAPIAALALVRGDLHSRVPATILIAFGGLIPAITSGANRFGATSGFFVGELLGVVFLFAGFLVSIEVFREIRIPFTHRVVRARRLEA